MELGAALERDTELMLRVRDGDGSSFASLLERYRGPVIQFMYHRVRDRGVAEELTQEVFLRVYRSRETYQPTARFTTWLFRIATHLAINSIRDRKSENANERLDRETLDGAVRQIFDRSPSVEQRLLFQVRLDEIRHAIQMLPAKQRAAVLMHQFDEMEYARIAAEFGCSESAIKSLLFRAYESLREQLAHFDGRAPGPRQIRRTARRLRTVTASPRREAPSMLRRTSSLS